MKGGTAGISRFAERPARCLAEGGKALQGGTQEAVGTGHQQPAESLKMKPTSYRTPSRRISELEGYSNLPHPPRLALHWSSQTQETAHSTGEPRPHG